MTDDTPQERQDNEFEALEAIFGKDLRDFRSPRPWKVWEPLDILLTLFPQQGSSGNQEIHCMIVLHIKCPAKYPEIEPVLDIQNSKGLSDSQLRTLLDELGHLSSNLKGEVMIFELAQHVQTFLHGYNKPGFKSFYEEMLSRQQQNEQMKLRDKQVKEDKERQEIMDGILRRQEILKSEMRLRKEPRHSLGELGNENTAALPMTVVNPAIERTRTYSARRRCQSTSESSDSSFCEHRGTKILKFSFKGDRQINRGRCLGHSERGCVVYAGLDMTTGELLTLSEWTIKLLPGQTQSVSPRIQSTAKKKVDSPTHTSVAHYDLSMCLKQIASVEQEMGFLMKLHHTNLVHYLNMKYKTEGDTLIVYLLQEFVMGGNISCLYLNDHINMEVDMLRHFASGLLEAVDFLHRNNVVHKDLRETSVFVDRAGVVRLADYSLDRRLMELCQGGNQGGRYSKKQDVFRIGVLLISLLKGSLITEADPQLPAGLPPDLKDFFHRCLDSNERTRWSAEQLLSHQFIKTPIERPSPQRSIAYNGRAGSDDEHGDSPEAMDIQLFIPTGANGQSRIKNEFEILKWLGKGAFGDVLKVKNKLDGGSYAIKRIELDPKNKQLNKKITREVKLLSRLSHENVVRYYNSWIESATLDHRREHDNSSASSTTYTQSCEKHQLSIQRPIESIDKNQDAEILAPPAPLARSVEWSVSYSSRSKVPTQVLEDDESSSEVDSSESEDDEDDVLISYLRDIKKSSSSDSVEFKYDDVSDKFDSCSIASSQEKKCRDERKTSSDSNTANGPDSVQIQYLYIQMEFCEKSTLRNAIDNGLCVDLDRMWRLFREIVEGLSHIHQQGMIHRDLKPVNIFLDSNDHVKIGDFGLATNILPRATQSVMEVRSHSEMDSYSHGDTGEGSMTGHVGTALYVAPELTTTGNKAIYNQKVDIYSLGIILFEMSYVPLKTGMERVKTLGNLRTKEIIMPDVFITPENSKQVYLIRWLLNHDVSGRPTCAELLQWDQLPGALEEYELREVLRHALMDTDSKAYKHLISACFQQEQTPAEDITYDMNLLKTAVSHNLKPHLLATYVKETVMKVFKLHSGVELSPPLLLPRCHLYDPVESSVRLMTHGGGVVHIPHDLRVPFARYVVWNGITMLKRYSIEKVYRENKIVGFHPTELYECSFDIVTPTPGNLFAEAELLSIVCEIAQEFPAMKSRNLTIRLNHTSLLKAVLLNCGIEPEKYNDIYSIFSDSRDGKLSKFQVQTHLISLCLSDHAMVALFSLMETECTVDKLGNVLKAFIKRKGEANTLAREGIKDLETIVYNAEVLGVKCPIVISPCMVYNIHQYSGMMCQFVCELKKKRRKGAFDVIAAGGRYDGMLGDLRKTVQHAGLGGRNEVSYQSAAGISLSLERLVQGACGSPEDKRVYHCTDGDVCVCATSSTKQATKEKAQIVNMLWAAGIKTSLIESTNLDEIQDVCRDLLTTHIIILKDSEQGTVRVRSWDSDRFQERKVPTNEIVEYMQRLVRTWNDDFDNASSGAGSNSTTVARSDSRVNFADSDRQTSSGAPHVSVNFVTPEKMAANSRRRYETLILAQTSSTIQKLSPKNRVEILAVMVDSTVLRSLAMHLESDVPQDEHDRTVRALIERHPRHKKYLMQICDDFRDLSLEKTKPIIALYSLQDSLFKVLI